MNNYKFRSETSEYRPSLSKDVDYNYKERKSNIEKEVNIPIDEVKKIYQKKTTSRLRVRKSPKGEILKILELGEVVNIIEEKDGWAQLQDGTFVMSQFLQ